MFNSIFHRAFPRPGVRPPLIRSVRPGLPRMTAYPSRIVRATSTTNHPTDPQPPPPDTSDTKTLLNDIRQQLSTLQSAQNDLADKFDMRREAQIPNMTMLFVACIGTMISCIGIVMALKLFLQHGVTERIKTEVSLEVLKEFRHVADRIKTEVSLEVQKEVGLVTNARELEQRTEEIRRLSRTVASMRESENTKK